MSLSLSRLRFLHFALYCASLPHRSLLPNYLYDGYDQAQSKEDGDDDPEEFHGGCDVPVGLLVVDAEHLSKGVAHDGGQCERCDTWFSSWPDAGISGWEKNVNTRKKSVPKAERLAFDRCQYREASQG